VENGTPPDIQSLLRRFDAMEKELAGLKAENLRLKAELARKDKIIAGLQQRLFGSSSEKLDPAQLQLELEELLLGKSAPPPETSGETPAPEEEKSKPAKTRRTKADRFPGNLKTLVNAVIIPEEVLASPGDWNEIGKASPEVTLPVLRMIQRLYRIKKTDPGAGYSRHQRQRNKISDHCRHGFTA
jgi:hypothetical protein